MSAVPAPARMMQLLTGYWVTQAIYVAAKLGLADLVKDGPRSPAELATATATHPRSLARLLRALASIGVFAEDDQGRFGQTDLSACLRGDVPFSQRGLALMNGEEHYLAYAELLYSVQTGQPSFDKVFGQPVFEFLAGHPRQAREFDEAMVGVHGAETRAMIDAYDFSVFDTLVDVGGGNGSLIREVLHAVPTLNGVVYDLDHVVTRARPNLPPRCMAVAGSFFESVPAGGDAYLLRHIIHDWDDDRSRTILENVRKVIPPTGKLLVIEGVVPPGNEPSFTKLLDLTMLAIPGGIERTEAEYRDLLAQAGFWLSRIVPTTSPVSVIEGVPA